MDWKSAGAPSCCGAAAVNAFALVRPLVSLFNADVPFCCVSDSLNEYVQDGLERRRRTTMGTLSLSLPLT